MNLPSSLNYIIYTCGFTAEYFHEACMQFVMATYSPCCHSLHANESMYICNLYALQNYDYRMSYLCRTRERQSFHSEKHIKDIEHKMDLNKGRQLVFAKIWRFLNENSDLNGWKGEGGFGGMKCTVTHFCSETFPRTFN